MAEEGKTFPEKSYKMDRIFAAIQYPISPMSMITEQIKSDAGVEGNASDTTDDKSDTEIANKTNDEGIRPEDGNLNN